jgi:sugar phosphate isomerase/epimerase
MAVYASTAAVESPRELWTILDDFADAGLAEVELGHAEVEEGEHLAERLRERPLRYLVHNYFPPPRESFVLNLASADPEVAERSLGLVVGALELASQIGAPLYAVHSGFITDPIGFDGTSFILPAPASSADAARANERFLTALETAIAHAARLDVTLLIENSVCTEALRGKLLALGPDEMAAVFAALPAPGFGLLLDTGHLNVTARTLGFDRLAYVDAVASHVRAWHVHDNDGAVDSHLPIAPGGWVHELLLRPALAGLPVTVESKFADVESLAKHVRWLREELR